jgi:glycerol-3-phosphate acyltransferase PlsY
MVLPAFAVFLAALLISRYVSLGSILAAAALFLTALGLAGSWAIRPIPPGPRLPALLAWALLAGLVIFKHRANLDRLFRGTESRFWGAKHD